MGVSVSSSALSVSNALLKRMNASSMGRPVSMLQPKSRSKARLSRRSLYRSSRKR